MARKRPDGPAAAHVYNEWAALAGLTCICPPGCTDVRWGDRRCCARGCEPCRIMSGREYHKPPRAG